MRRLAPAGTWLAISMISCSCYAQLFGEQQKLNTEFIPQSACVAAIAFPKQIAENPQFDLFPREIVTAWGKETMGFDPMLIEQITFVVQTPGDPETPPLWAAILHFKQMQGLSDNLIKNMQQKQLGGKTLYSSSDPELPSFLVYDEATMLMGNDGYFAEMVDAASRQSELAQLIKNSKLKGQAFAFLDMKAVRPFLVTQLANTPPLPPVFQKMKQIPELMNELEVSLNFQNQMVTTVKLRATNEENGEQLQKIITDGLEFGKNMLLAQMAGQMDFDDPIQAATMEYAQRIGDTYEAKLTPDADGRELTLTLENESAVVPVLVGMLLPAVQGARGAARRAQSMNNSKQMLLALHNYADVNKAFPAQANYDDNGRPMLSWRVHVLPYIDEQDLYDEFHLDEPWDSPHNKQLIPRMPRVYVCPDIPYNGDGKTVYLGVAGEGMAFDGTKGRKLMDFTDGTSNSAVMVEVDPSRAVVWTKPEDYNVKKGDPLDGLRAIRPGGFSVGMADGSVRIIAPSVEPNQWFKMLTIAGDDEIGD